MKKRIAFAVLLVAAMIFWQYFLKGYLLLPSADRFVDSFYDQYNQQEFGYLYDVLSHQKIRTKLTRDQFLYMMADTYVKLGPAKDRKRVKWKHSRTKGVTLFSVDYMAQREKNSALEKFVLIKQKKDWFVYNYEIHVV